MFTETCVHFEMAQLPSSFQYKPHLCISPNLPPPPPPKPDGTDEMA